MKKLIILFLLIATRVVGQDDLDSLFYSGNDTVGISKLVAADEKAWVQEDTNPAVDYTAIDQYVLSITKKYRDIPELAKDLTAPYNKESDKVRAIFRWMTNNIVYDFVAAKDKDRSYGGSVSSGLSREKQAEKWGDIFNDYATNVLRKKTGVCEGYSVLFFELCKSAGIKCEIVHGKADISVSETPKLRGHAWNKVSIDGQWFYLDACWASVDSERLQKNKDVNDLFYITPAWRQLDSHFENVAQTKRVNYDIGNY